MATLIDYISIPIDLWTIVHAHALCIDTIPSDPEISKWNQSKWLSNCTGFHGHCIMSNSSIHYLEWLFRTVKQGINFSSFLLQADALNNLGVLLGSNDNGLAALQEALLCLPGQKELVVCLILWRLLLQWHTAWSSLQDRTSTIRCFVSCV